MKRKLSGAEKKYLRGLAHNLNPIIQIGKTGVEGKVVAHIDLILRDHELIKVRFNEFKEERKELAAVIADQTQSDLVGMIGNIAILYREHPDKDKRKVLPSMHHQKALSPN